MRNDFDRVIDRRNTESNKWHKFPPDVLPLWVADMDFPSPEPVIRALRERVEHGVFGYGVEQPEFHEVLCDRLLKRYGWKVGPEALVLMPGVTPGNNVACRAFAGPRDGVLMQLPVYPPILRVPDNIGMSRDGVDLIRGADGRYTIDFDAVERAITPRTRMFVLCNPHNPVGRVFTRDELSRMAEICLRRGLVICPTRSTRPRLRRTSARADRLARPGDRAPHDHDDGAEQDLQPARAQILDRHHPRRVAPGEVLARGWTSFERRISSTTRRWSRTGTGSPGWTSSSATSRQDFAEIRPGQLRGVEMVCPGTLASSLPPERASRRRPSPSSSGGRVALSDGATFGPGSGLRASYFGCPRSLLTHGLERMGQALGRLPRGGP
jgi:cystathionine beta-lyase